MSSPAWIVAFSGECRLRQPSFQILAAARAPPLVVAGQEKLEGFRKARLTRSVPAHDEREAGTGAECELDPRPDAPETFDRDRADVGANRYGGLRLSLDSGFVGDLAAEAGFDFTEKGSQNEIGDFSVERRIGFEPFDDVGYQRLVHYFNGKRGTVPYFLYSRTSNRVEET